MKYILGEIFPYIVALYLIDGIAYIKNHHVLFVSHFGRGFKLKEAGWYLIGLWPAGHAVRAHRLPLCLTSRGVYVVTGEQYKENGLYEAKDFHFIGYEGIADFETREKVIKINEKIVIETPSPGSAKHLSEAIQALKALPAPKRREKIKRFLAEMADIEALRALEELCAAPLAYLKILTLILFVCAFIMLPISLYTEWGAVINLPYVLLYMALIYLTILAVTYVALRKLRKKESQRTAPTLLALIFSPAASIHAINHLTLDLYARFDYLAIAAHLLPTYTFQSLIRKERRCLEYTRARAENDDLEEFWSLRENSLRQLMDKVGISNRDVLAAPTQKDLTAVSYCPLCETEYRSGFDHCNDCGVNLMAFDKGVRKQ